MRGALVLAAVTFALPLYAQVAISTGQYNTGRTNANLAEFILNTANVNPNEFGLLYSRQVDGQVYAQPLYIPRVPIQGRPLNLVYVATMHNSVYAFTANFPSASAPVWHVNLGPSVPFNLVDLRPEVGILSTPVIDKSTGTMYVVALTLENGTSAYWLHALDITNGAEKFNGPVVIQASVPGSAPDGQNGIITFNTANQLQRPALLLFGGMVHIAFGTASPDLSQPYHGWLLSYDARTLGQRAAFNTTANGSGGGIWMSGVGPAADLNGLYFVTGNGSFGNGNTGESVVRIGGGTGDFFTPDDWQTLNAHDRDLGAGGALLIPGSNLLTVAGKTGTVYVLSRTNLGQLTQGNTQAVQSFQATAGCSAPGWFSCNHIHHMAYWYRTGASPLLYTWGWNEPLKAFAMVSGTFDTTPVAQNGFRPNFPGGVMALTANGGSAGSGILWAVTSTENAYLNIVPGVLHAYNAANVANELWNSEMNPPDRLGNMAKFSVPTVANGKVFVPTFSNKLMVYGLR